MKTYPQIQRKNAREHVYSALKSIETAKDKLRSVEAIDAKSLSVLARHKLNVAANEAAILELKIRAVLQQIHHDHFESGEEV